MELLTFGPKLSSSAVVAAIAILLSGFTASAHDVTDTTIARTSANNATLDLSFSKQLYKTIYTDEPYTVEVPYQTTETYWDTEPYTTQHYVCHTYSAPIDLKVGSAGTEQASMLDWPGNKAGGFPGGPPAQGFPRGGGDDPKGGFPGRGPGGSPPVPVPGGGGGWHPGGDGDHDGDHGGGWHPGGGPGGPGYPPQHIPQQHCGFESVTEYRQVQRTRTVTRYRTESRCCQSVAHSVPDHVWSQPVELRFPAEAALFAGETEKLEVSLAGTEATPSVKIASRQAIFRYAIVRQDLSGGVLVATLAVVPTLTEKDLGAKTIGSVTLDFQAAELEVRIQDAVKNPHITSAFDVRIFEKGTTTVLGETTAVVREGLVVRAPLAGAFDAEKDYVVQLSVTRSGAMVVAPVTFLVEKTILAEKLDLKKLADKSQLGSFSTNGNLDALVLRFRDGAAGYKTVKTEYAFKIALKDKKGLTPVAAGSVDNQALKLDKDGRVLVPLKDTFHLDAATVALLAKNKTLSIQLVVTRTSKRIGQISITRTGEASIN